VLALDEKTRGRGMYNEHILTIQILPSSGFQVVCVSGCLRLKKLLADSRRYRHGKGHQQQELVTHGKNTCCLCSSALALEQKIRVTRFMMTSSWAFSWHPTSSVPGHMLLLHSLHPTYKWDKFDSLAFEDTWRFRGDRNSELSFLFEDDRE
jgi:hypothetical protein